MADYQARLPLEAEWEAVPPTGADAVSWEWCADPYAPLDFIKASNEAVNAAGSPERPVRRSIAPDAGASVKTETRASLPPAFCSSFVSFRPVIAPRKK
jgi:formylglycine-generating enzyme required for sulfatase activity